MKIRVRTGVPSEFVALFTRCLTSALISIHHPLIFVTKSIRLTHFHGQTMKSIHRERAEPPGASGTFLMQPLNEGFISLTYIVCVSFEFA